MWLILKLVISIILSARAVVPEIAVPEPTPVVTGQGEAGQVQQRVNALRAEHGLSPLSWDSRLAEVAGIRSEQVLTHAAHENYVQLAAERGILDGYLGENIAITWSIDRAWENWLNSPSHYALMLDPDWQRVGVYVRPIPGGVSIVAIFRQD